MSTDEVSSANRAEYHLEFVVPPSIVILSWILFTLTNRICKKMNIFRPYNSKKMSERILGCNISLIHGFPANLRAPILFPLYSTPCFMVIHQFSAHLYDIVIFGEQK